MKKRMFFLNAVILTGTGLALRLVGMFFRVYLAGRIGDEGMGVYQLIFTLYNLSIALATSGVTVAATSITGAQLAKGASPAGACRRVTGYAAAVGAAVGLAQLALARPAALFWLREERAIPALCILAPSLPFMAAGAALRGCFMARRQVASSSRAQLFEQAVRIGLVLLLLDRALPLGVGAACAAVVAGNTVSEALSCLYMAASWRRSLRPAGGGAGAEKQPAPPKGVGRAYRQIVLPVAATRGVSSLLVAAENVLVPACLARCLGAREPALAQFGRLKGMAMPVLFFPFSFLATLSALLLPEIVEAHAAGQKKRLAGLCSRTILVTMVFGGLAGGLFVTFSAPLGQLLYQSAEIGFYLLVLGPLMPLMYLESMVDGILKGVGQQGATFRYSLCDSAMRILLTALLVPRWGMRGFLLVMILSNLFTSLMNLRRLLKTVGMGPRWGRWALGPGLAALAGWAAYRFAFAVWAAPHLPKLAGLALGAGAFCAVYLLFLQLSGCITVQELFCLLRRRPAAGPDAGPSTPAAGLDGGP